MSWENSAEVSVTLLLQEYRECFVMSVWSKLALSVPGTGTGMRSPSDRDFDVGAVRSG